MIRTDMRPLETLLLISNVLALARLAVPRYRERSWTDSIALITLLIGVIQVLAEGPRWQMIPAYALTIFYFVLWLIDIGSPGRIRINRLMTLLGVGVGVLVLVVAIALPVLLPVFHFPQPTGPYAIGTVAYHWTDSSRPELFTSDPDDHRELMAQVWYPAKSQPSAPRAPYIQDADAVTAAMARLIRFPAFLFTHFREVTTNAVASAPMADDESSYPVLLFLSGLNGFRAVNMFQIEELVSHGYVVVGLDQPGAVAMTRFPDGRQISGWPRDEIQPLIMQSVESQQTVPAINGTALPDGIIPYFAADVSFALDQLSVINGSDPQQFLTGRLDLGRVGTFGISLGGMNAAAACLNDSRLKACLIMDIYIPADVVEAGLQQPSMFISRDAGTMRHERERAGGWSEHDISLTLDTMRAVYERLPGDGYYVEIPRMFHLNFTDFPYWSPITSLIGLAGPIDGQRGFDIINAYSLAFFNQQLKEQPSPLLGGPSSEFPEATFATRRT